VVREAFTPNYGQGAGPVNSSFRFPPSERSTKTRVRQSASLKRPQSPSARSIFYLPTTVHVDRIAHLVPTSLSFKVMHPLVLSARCAEPATRRLIGFSASGLHGILQQQSLSPSGSKAGLYLNDGFLRLCFDLRPSLPGSLSNLCP
jgi:hypothetical protein